MTSYSIEASYHTGATSMVEFPEGKSWEDVQDWYVKWDTLYVRFNDTSDHTDYTEFALNYDSTDGTDWKRPTSVTVYGYDADGEVDYIVEAATS